MHEWEFWAPGDPHRGAVLDTHTGRAVCVSFKHTMHVIQTSLSAHKDSMQLCPPPSVRNRDRQEEDVAVECFTPTYTATGRAPSSPPTPSSSSGRRGFEGACLCSHPSSGCKCFESKMSVCVCLTPRIGAMVCFFI